MKKIIKLIYVYLWWNINICWLLNFLLYFKCGKKCLLNSISIFYLFNHILINSFIYSSYCI